MLNTTEGMEIATRPVTKDKKLRDAGIEELIKSEELSHPRVPTREMTASGRGVQRFVAAEMIRYADMTQPQWQPGVSVGSQIREWWCVPWIALVRELLAAGWGQRVWREAVASVTLEIGAMRTPDKEHRARVIAAMGHQALLAIQPKQPNNHNNHRHHHHHDHNHHHHNHNQNHRHRYYGDSNRHQHQQHHHHQQHEGEMA